MENRNHSGHDAGRFDEDEYVNYMSGNRPQGKFHFIILNF